MPIQASAPFSFNNNSNNSNNAGNAPAPTTLPFNSFTVQPVHRQHAIAAQLSSRNNINYSSSSSLVSFYEKHSKETEQQLLEHNKRLRSVLLQQTNQQKTSLLNLLEQKATTLLKREEEELAKAKKRSTELEELIRRKQEQSYFWQRIATETETAMIALTNAIDQLRDDTCYSSAAFCSEDHAASDGDGSSLKPCKCCLSRDSCVLMLPCLHVCCCKPCAVLLESCPLCGSPKKNCIEILLAHH